MAKEVTQQNFALTAEQYEKVKDNLTTIDVRAPRAYAFDHIEGAINLPHVDFSAQKLQGSSPVCLYCRDGSTSEKLAQSLRESGITAYFIEGGYTAYNRCNRTRKIEESLRTTFHARLFTKFAKAVATYKLISPGDKIAVCISGGKDSMLMAELFRELQRHGEIPFSLTFLLMDPGYSPQTMQQILKNADLLRLPLTIFQSDIFAAAQSVEKSPCYLCARMRRGHLYAEAQKLGCNKIALGHHYDDVIETILLGMLYGGQVQTMLPKLDSTNFAGMQLIRPMYLIRESDVIAWAKYNDLEFIRCACRFTAEKQQESKRLRVKKLIAELKKEDPEIEQNIFKSVENVNLSTIVGYKDEKGVRHRFDDKPCDNK